MKLLDQQKTTKTKQSQVKETFTNEQIKEDNYVYKKPSPQEKANTIKEVLDTQFIPREDNLFNPDNSNIVVDKQKKEQTNIDVNDFFRNSSGKDYQGLPIKEIFDKLTQVKNNVDLQPLNNGLLEPVIDTNHNGDQSFVNDHIRYKDDSELVTGLLEGATFNAFDKSSGNALAVDDYYSKLTN